jgi:hypothetical protein
VRDITRYDIRQRSQCRLDLRDRIGIARHEILVAKQEAGGGEVIGQLRPGPSIEANHFCLGFFSRHDGSAVHSEHKVGLKLWNDVDVFLVADEAGKGDEPANGPRLAPRHCGRADQHDCLGPSYHVSTKYLEHPHRTQPRR